MLTRMTDEDWATVLEVFRAARSRRGDKGRDDKGRDDKGRDDKGRDDKGRDDKGRDDKGRDDRKFLEAIHYFSVHNITWRALPAMFGNWNSVWKRFWRLSQAGVFEAFFEALAALSRTAHLVQMFDSTVVRAHVSAAGAKGGNNIRRWAARAGASRPRSTSRLISTEGRLRSTSRRVRRATARSARSCSTSGRTSRPALR